MNVILVVGATGNVGGEVAAQLSEMSVPVRALLRNPQGANIPEEIERVRGDLSQPETVAEALHGVDSVFLMMPPASANIPAFAERASGRVRQIVFVSSAAVRDDEVASDPLAMLHADAEKAIERSGVEWTFVRPGYYATNTIRWWGRQLRDGDVIRWPFGALSLAPIDPRDIARVAVRALVGEGHSGAKYVLTGPQAVTFAEQVETIGNVLGRKLRYDEVPPETVYELLTDLPRPVLDMILETWKSLLGKSPVLTNAVERVTGSPAHSFGDWVRRNTDAFQRAA
jgi:uncharacterized protein YbjT (DUF2867 family)